jgi:hypothetical protein
MSLPAGLAQQLQQAASIEPALLTIHLANVTAYYQNTVTLNRLAKSKKFAIDTTKLKGNNFFPLEVVADIVQINNDAVKGLYLSKNRVTFSAPPTPGKMTPPAGTMISDASITGFRHDIFKILNPDSTEIGSIMAAGVSGQPIAPGGPSIIGGGDWAIIGGTGAFLGASGQMGGQGGTGKGGGGIRAASVKEDPSNRRALAAGGNYTTTMYLSVIPMIRPQIIAVYHADPHTPLTPITSAHPVKAGDRLMLFASGLGPVAGVPIGEPFPATPPAVTSPVSVVLGGVTISVPPGNPVGFPGSMNGYSFSFTVPAGVKFQFGPPFHPAGQSAIQVISAWIPSPALYINVQ